MRPHIGRSVTTPTASLDWHAGYREGLLEGGALVLLLAVAAAAMRRAVRV